MKINIRRFNKELSTESTITKYEVNNTNLLKALIEIKEEIDSSLSFRCGCKSGVCGSCAVKVNGVERLACKVFIKEDDLIEPLKNIEVIKDLIVNVSHETLLINKTKSYINKNSNKEIKQENIEKIDLQSNCILCNSCFSSCPVYDVKDSFIGPFALSRALRYVNDEKLESNDEIISSVQTDGIWDCTLCSACTLVCPQGIDPKADIMQLQNISVQKGYTNPNFQNFSFDFNDDFGGGFNPNGF
ncbi:MAG: succinate dehydrogenase/fumarate reductase iron-sulfur subunit [Arcobacter sp.]|nr:succinate dehydrogenase/fumarate reductase iron-sulfur subunit [Arcobacter sp.]